MDRATFVARSHAIYASSSPRIVGEGIAADNVSLFREIFVPRLELVSILHDAATCDGKV